MEASVDNVAVLWADQPTAPMNFPGGDPTLPLTDMLPEPGGARFERLHFCSENLEAVMTGPAGYESAHRIAGLEMNTVSERGGWHATTSLDHGAVVQGVIDIHMRNGDSVTLRAGDTFVQRGEDHRWEAHTDEDVVIMVVKIGRPVSRQRRKARAAWLGLERSSRRDRCP